MSRARSGVALAAFAALVACLLFAATGRTHLDSSTIAAHPGGSQSTTGAGHLVSAGAQAVRGSSMLPAPAQGPLSAAIGRSEEAYWIRGVAAANPSQHLGLRFANDGVVVASAGSSLRLGLGSLGRTRGPMVPLAAARPDVARNRVTYDRGAVDEWYANGPIGLEQGFDIRSRPQGSGLLTVSIPASRDVKLESARDGAVVLQGPHGRSLLYTGLSANDARGHSLRAWLAHRGASLLIYVDDRTARYPVRIDPFVQQTELLPPGSGNPQFGQSVAVSSDGNTALIGAPYTGFTATTGQAPGAAYVYVRSGGTWSEQTELVGTGAIGDAFQGSSVALSADGNTAIVGGPSDDSYVGAAWVFTRSGTTWTQVSKLVALTFTGGPDPSAEQGWSVALSGDGATALLGAPYDGGNDVGATWVFVKQNGTWTQRGSKLTATTHPAQQGYSVALSTDGSTALVGGPDDTTTEGGGAWVYTRSGTTWSQQGSELVGATNLEASAEGRSVALSGDGNTALIGGNNDTSSGGVWVFTRSGSTWSEQGSELLGTGNTGNAGQGFSVALSTDGNTALVGGPYDNSSTGAAWLFTRSGSTWSQLGSKLVGTGGKAGTHGIQQGYAVGLSGDGNTAVVGGPANGDGIGGVWVFVNGPSVTAVSPTSGPAAGGNQITITGTNFTGATGVSFGSTAATNVTVVNSTTITATAPAYTGLTHQDGSAMVDVTVTTPAGTSATSSADQYTYDSVPTVTAVSPSAGPTAGGTLVTITGTHLVAGATVAFGANPATNVTVVNSGSITATAPASSAGAVDVTVTTAGGTSATGNADHYTYDAPPTVTGVSPTSGPLAGGNTVTITGTNLTGATAVSFGDTPATSLTVDGATSISATAPAESGGTIDITVTTPGGTSATSTADHYTYVVTPTVTVVSPSQGPLGGGTIVSITGTGFTNASAVKFGATNATSFTLNSATSITATSPAESAGTVDITVTTPGGTTATSTADQYTFVAAPTVTGVSPTSGPLVGGDTVTISGTNLTNATAVKFGSTNATNITLNTATSITAIAPAETAGTVDITVTTAGGTSATSSVDHYTYLPTPTVTAVSPTAGPLGAGTPVTITGTNLSGATAVKFGGTNATITADTATQITATAPAGTAGTVDVTVTTAGGTSATSTGDHYTYTAAPTITGVSPSAGPLGGGTHVTITGTNLSGATAVTFGTANATITADTATSITATAPAETAGTVDITVTTVGGTSAISTADHYTYTSGPVVTSISPTSGPLAGGTSVTITGASLSGATAVEFGTTTATVTADTATQITATAPAETAGAVDITVATPGGTSPISPSDRYTYTAAPTITGVSPISGPLTGGTAVTILGTNLANATAVKFGTANATSLPLDTATSITAIAPAKSAGPIDITVTTPGGTSSTSSADQYTYIAAPTVTSVNPASGPSTGGTVVTITGANLTGTTAVSFGSTAATSVTANSGGTQITATSPAQRAGTVGITVTTPGGTSATNSADQYTYTTQTVTTTGGNPLTVSSPPSVTPNSPSAQTSTSAGLSGQVNPNGLSTTAYFEYGIDLSDRGPGSSTVLYDQTTPAQQVGSDSTEHPVSIPVAGLVPNALYHVRMVASNSAGTTVGPDQAFTTPASAPPPPPVLGQAVNVSVVSGQVFIEPPPGKSLGGAGDTAALSKGTGFVPLTEARQIPTGSEIDALNGSLKMVSNTGQVGKTQTATLTGGVFKVTQTRNGITKGMADFNLIESAFQGAPSYGTCKAKHKASDATIASLSSKTLQLLKVSGHGKFKTTGRYASATVRGTIYTVADRCDGTLTHVIRDTVLVDDFVRHRTILLHAGQSYLAKKP